MKNEHDSEAQLQASLERLARAWNAGDAAGWAAEFWPDGEQVNILGDILPSADVIRDRHAEVFAGPFKNSHYECEQRRVLFLGSDFAIVDSTIRVTNFRGLPPATVATSPGVLLTRMKQLYERRNGLWRIASAQNTAVISGAPGSTSQDRER
ncbi:MAG: SgcJ/EcaC family oxidoreductase [Dokdonella sp.]